MRISTVAPVFLLLAACSKSPSTPPPSSERAELTAPECEARGGKVVGDIGDGAIHQPGYVCPDSGQPPIATIIPEPGGPIAIEGAVCCE